MSWLAVAVGGALGSMARHGVNRLIHEHWPALRFPAATAVVNLTGCFVIGLLAGLTADRLVTRAYVRELVVVGFLGGYTTFSTFGLDTFMLARTPSASYAAANVIAQVVGGLLAVWVGYQLGASRT